MKRSLLILVLILVALCTHGCVVVCMEDTDPCESTAVEATDIAVDETVAVPERACDLPPVHAQHG
jgi:hypothetical protein